MLSKMNRRDFVKSTVLGASMATAAGMSSFADTAQAQWTGWSGAVPNFNMSDPLPPFQKKREIPTGTIAGTTFSRMMLGGNLLTHHSHSRDLHYVNNLAAHYNTPQKIHETMRIAEEHGINTVVIHTATGVLDGIKKYKERGGTIKTIICSIAPINEDMAEYTQSCQECVDAGVDALYLWGVHSDGLVGTQPELIKKAVNTMKSFGIPAGVGAHQIEVVEYCEREKVKNDFYIKTLHHHNYPTAKLNYDSSWCDNAEKHIEVLSKVEKPWIAFKIMAAGAIPPKNALDFAFTSGADFVIFGMFDYEIDEDTRHLNEVLAQDSVKNRARKWFG